MRVTNHAEDRLRERAGFNRKAAARMAQRALSRGLKHRDAVGRLRSYLDGLFLAHGTANNMRVYGEFVYLFKADTLITVLSLPRELRASARAALDARPE